MFEIKPSKKLYKKIILTYVTISCFAILLAGVIILISSIVKDGNPQKASEVVSWIFGLLIFVIWLFGPWLSKVWFRNLSYLIDDKKITLRTGILSRVERNIPYRGITDFTLHKSLFDRYLGIATIKIQTAGQSPTASGYEAMLAGLEDYNQLYLKLKQHINKEKDAPGITNESLYSESELLTKILMELKAFREIIEQERNK